VPERRLAIVGTRDGELTPEEVDTLLAARRAEWVPPPPRHTSGILALYAKMAASTADGAYIA
jgi:dihydroxy-acid dehydratase